MRLVERHRKASAPIDNCRKMNVIKWVPVKNWQISWVFRQLSIGALVHWLFGVSQPIAFLHLPVIDRLNDRENNQAADLVKDTFFLYVKHGDLNCLPPDPNQVAQPVLVCTAHIHWDPEFCDVKLIQIMMLQSELKHILEETSLSFNKSGHKPDTNAVQLLLCGDFNSLPDSGVIEFLSTGRVPSDHQDFKDLPYKSVLSKISDCDQSNEFTHSYKLASAYSEDIMPYTNYTFHFKGIIDYIFYSKQNMTPLGLLGPLAADWLRDNKVIGCPHPHIPSDHFPLLVELEMTPSLPSTSNGIISSRR